MPGAPKKGPKWADARADRKLWDKGKPSDRQARRMAAKEMERRLAEHPCGSCDACCTIKGVIELEKPEGVRCEHLTTFAARCGIYAERPAGCRDWFCAYRFGLLGDRAWRPDLLNLMFDLATSPPPGIMLMKAYEVVPGAIDAAMPQLNEMASKGIVIYFRRGEKNFYMGPEERVKACQEWARRHLPLVAR